MPIQSPRSRVLYTLALFASLAVPLQAQTIDDGIMLRQHELLTGNFYSHDSWDEYWEGALKRTNGNIGTITTETNVFAVNYGLFDRFNVIGNVPYVWTNASQGVLHGIQGFQDLSLAGKWTAHETPAGDGVLRTILVVAAGIPLTNYNPELLPLSIGMGSTRVSWRGTVNYQTNPGWYVNGTTAYTVRSHVKLDRPYYQTGDEFVMSDRVDMPNVFDYTASGGYMKDGLMAAAFFSQQQTLGGDDIRRQDMPLMSNQMNFARAGLMLLYPVPKARTLGVHVSVAHNFAGRNVGQGTTFTTGLQYIFNGGSTR
ncbi:MAG TPA: hypothetical protein VFS23_06835 [Vicinamibacterales bacterium]|nr:hypothetical protein [Vicinamibacterales bacterium]